MDDALLADAKRHALDTGRSLTRLIQDAVVALIQRERAARRAPPIDFPIFDGGGVMPGIDIDNSASLLDAMEQPEEPANQ